MPFMILDDYELFCYDVGIDSMISLNDIQLMH